MFAADIQMFSWVRGTSFGRDVVPDVCNTNAQSLPLQHSPVDEELRATLQIEKAPAALLSEVEISRISIPSFLAITKAGES
jgi:hypothetical protein